jgi:Arc/MetJ-type ribon-helix-helix transcriptional regulator
MPTVQISDELKEVVDQHVAAGAAEDAARFVEQAVLRYAEDLTADEDELIAAAQEGIDAISRGEFVTIASPQDQAALRERLWNSAMLLAEQMEAADSAEPVAPQVPVRLPE